MSKIIRRVQMKRILKNVVYYSLFILSATPLFNGCETSKITSLWRDPEFNPLPVKNVIVISPWKNKVQRRLWEDAFVEVLKEKGVNAAPSYRTSPNTVVGEDDIQKLLKDNYDGVILIRKVSEKTRQFYVPGDYFGWYGGPFYWHRSMIYGGFWNPGYIEDDKYVQFETSVWEAGRDGNMVWAAVTETINPTSFKGLRHDIMELVIPGMVKSGVLPGGSKVRLI
jgi:hypothetical protein